MERLYPENQWVTPSELFKPFYGYTIASFMVNQMENRGIRNLRVVEIGPGTGTLADSMLDFYKNYSLDLYRNCEYVFVEISSQLAEKCEKLMKERHRKLYDENRIKIYNCSIFDDFLMGKKDKIDEHCFVVGMEILDNMPHDRLIIDNQGTKETNQNFDYQLQSIIELSQNPQGIETLKEVFEPVGSDPLIVEFLELLKSMPPPDHVTLNNKM